MNRIDWVIVRRLGGSVILTVAVMFAIVALVESLKTTRYEALSAIGGPGLAILAIIVASTRWILDTLPLTVLIGAIIGLLNLQATREMTVIKASGMSVWRLMKAPLAVALVGGLAITLVVDTLTVQLNRDLTPASPDDDVTAGSGHLWREERAGGLHYIIEAGYVQPSGESLGGVSIFMLDAPRIRIEADIAELVDGEWRMPTALRFQSNEVAETVTDLRIPASSTRGDLKAELASVRDMTVFELASSIASRLHDPELRSETLTRFFKLIGLPVALAGSLVIAFAFTAGYRRTNKYGGAVLYGIVLGFVVYVVTEMANRAGDAGVMQPAVAVFAPALVALVIGVTVLLNREDGRT